MAPSLFVALVLAVAPHVEAQGGGTGVAPVDGAKAWVEYQVNQTMNPGNGTAPPGNGTTPPSGNTTQPPPGNGTTPPSGNGTTPPGNGTTPPGGNETIPPDGNETTPPDENETAPPDGNETIPPDGNETLPPDGNETLPPDDGEAAPPDGNETSGGGGDGGSAPPATGGTDTGGTGTACLVACDLDTGDGDETQAGEDRSRPVCAPCGKDGTLGGAPVAGFPWLPLLATLILGPLVGLLMARAAIQRWQKGRPSRAKPQVHAVGTGGPRDAHDPLRSFLQDVKEWKALPPPGSPESKPGI